jgi:4-hydroxy-tetrahydrodipicolinate reductase
MQRGFLLPISTQGESIMQALILGDGPMGHALADTLAARGDAVVILGRPEADAHDAAAFEGAEVVIDFSRGDAVQGNATQALTAGCRRLVIGTSGWDAERSCVAGMLTDAGAAGVWGASFSIGVTLFMGLVEETARRFGRFEEYDPFVVEWHRAAKFDCPSGTAQEIVRRLVAAHPRKRVAAEPGSAGPRLPEELDVTSIRAGAAPGMHLVGFDAAGETLELRLTARDRSAYAAGAIAAAGWLLAEARPPGLYPFDTVIADLASAPEELPR